MLPTQVVLFRVKRSLTGALNWALASAQKMSLRVLNIKMLKLRWTRMNTNLFPQKMTPVPQQVARAVQPEPHPHRYCRRVHRAGRASLSWSTNHGSHRVTFATLSGTSWFNTGSTCRCAKGGSPTPTVHATTSGHRSISDQFMCVTDHV